MKKDFNQYDIKDVMAKLEKLATHNPKDLAGMARFGINVENAWVISIPKLRKLAKEVGKNHQLALKLWDTKVHEARILAGFVDEPEKVTEAQMEKWVADFDSWDVCDLVCSSLFDRTSFAYKKALEWSKRREEFIKRAGFVLMAALSVHDKSAGDEKFYPFLEAIKREATDERNFVRKAVNWALRQIGKSRNKNLYKRALKTAEEILKPTRGGQASQNDISEGAKAARWIANDAIRELNKDYIKKKFV